MDKIALIALKKSGAPDISSAIAAKEAAQDAQSAAETAQGKAEDAQEAAETAQGKAEDAQEAAEAVLESIPQDYSEMSADVSDLKSQTTASTIVVQSESKPIVQIADGSANKAKSYDVQIVPQQAGSGDPSPTNVRPITGFTGAELWNDPEYAPTIDWNQIYPTQTVNFTGTNYTLKSENDGKYVITATATATQSAGANHTNLIASVMTANHVYALLGSNNDIRIMLKAYSGAISDSVFRVTTPSYTNIAFVFTDLAAGTYEFYPILLDLTQMFGTTRANEILAMGSSAGAAYVRSLFPNKYYAYNTGGVITCVSAVNGHPFSHQTITFPQSAGTVYGGNLHVNEDGSGTLTVTQGYIASYAGETLPGKWISDRDTYAPGTSPSTGAQVVYELATPQTYTLTAPQIALLLGTNNIWSDTGGMAVEYIADTKLYIQTLTGHPDEDMIADANITSGSFFMVGNTLYLATANIANGSAVIPGTNCTQMSLAAALNSINA